MAARGGYAREVEFPKCSEGGELIINTSRGDCSITPNLLGLQFFQVRGKYFNQVIGDKSKELVSLRWFDPGQRNLRSLSSLQNLRVLELNEHWGYGYRLEELWETNSNSPLQLRQLIISGCLKFQGFPKSIGCLRDLKIIVLKESRHKISSLPESFCFLQSLEHLSLRGSAELSSLPSSFGDLRNLRHLDLSWCEKLRSLSDSFKKLTLLQHLCLYGCSNLALKSDILENMTKVEYLNLVFCKQLEELPHHITNQASLRELDLGGTSIREIPMNISRLNKLQKFYVGSKLLTSLPTSLGDLFFLTTLWIDGCPKLELLPDSVGRLNLLENLYIGASGLKSLPKSFSQTQVMVGSPISGLDLGAGSLTSSLCNLKLILLDYTEVSKISISEDCCPSLDCLHLRYNEHLTEIEVLPTTVKQLRVESCGMLRNINGIVGLVNIKELRIIGCPELDALPSFAQLASLQVFKLIGCYGVEKIQGLEHCRALEELTADTRWEEAGIESLEVMERLRTLQLTAISRSGVEGCIRSMQDLQKWGEEIIVCTRAVPDSGSLLDSFPFTNLSVIDSISNKTFLSNLSLKSSSNAHCILLCLVVNCNEPQITLSSARTRSTIKLQVEEGKWVLICVFTQRSSWHKSKQLDILSCDVERGMVVLGEEERVAEAFHGLWALFSN